MKIALVAHGGFERTGREAVIPALLNLVARLARRHEVHVFTLSQVPYPEPASYPLLGATVHNLAALPGPRGSNSHSNGRPSAGGNHTGHTGMFAAAAAAGGAGGKALVPGLRLLRAASRLVRGLRAVGPVDVLHGYQGMPAGTVAMVAARRLRMPFVVTFDSNELVTLPEIGYGLGLSYRGRLARRLIARSADRITVSTLYMSLLAREQGLKAEVIPLGVDLTMVPPQAPASEGPPWRLLHVANINPVKDQATLLQALALVRAQEPAVHLHIVGVDTLGGAIHAQADLLGLGGHVTFTGARAANEVWPYYARSHLLLLPSRHEAAGVVVLEAAACSLPTVGTDVGYVSEWALRGAARAVRVGDAPALARAILELLRDRAARRRMAEEARSLAIAHNADWTAERFEELYQELRAARATSSGRAAVV
jgi:glycosyltransferase involved in cell wall biosynthesis